MPAPRLSPHRAAVTALVFSFALGALAGACGTANRCDRVRCSDGMVCEAATGRCIPGDGDGGTSDGGTSDGGTGDAGCSPACAAPQVCDPATASCVECLTDVQCTCPTTSCSPGRTCVVPVDAGTLAPAESCGAATPLSVCAGSYSFVVDLARATDDHETGCGLADGGARDMVARFTLAAPADVRLTAAPASGSPAQPLLALLRGCDGERELACQDGNGGTAAVTVKSVPAGTYAVVVDGYDSSAAGVVNVTVELLAPTLPANDMCGTAADLPLDGGPLSGDLTIALDEVKTSCSDAGSPDLFYGFTLTETSDVFVTATPLDAGVDLVLSLRSGACGAGRELSCVDSFSSAAETLRGRSLAPGAYVVALESYGQDSAGPFTIAGVSRPPAPVPTNDSCAAPRPVTFASGSSTATLTVDTWCATDDHEGFCNPRSLTDPVPSPEVVYALTLTSARTVTVSAQGAGGAPTDAVVYLRSGACDTGADVECADAFPPSPDTFTVSLPAGTYYLFVEGYTEVTSGPTVVTVTLSP